MSDKTKWFKDDLGNLLVQTEGGLIMTPQTYCSTIKLSSEIKRKKDQVLISELTSKLTGALKSMQELEKHLL